VCTGVRAQQCRIRRRSLTARPAWGRRGGGKARPAGAAQVDQDKGRGYCGGSRDGVMMFDRFMTCRRTFGGCDDGARHADVATADRAQTGPCHRLREAVSPRSNSSSEAKLSQLFQRTRSRRARRSSLRSFIEKLKCGRRGSLVSEIPIEEVDTA